MDTRQRGDYSELLVLAELAAQGRRFAIPFGNCEGFDLLVFGKGKMWNTIQVKTARRRSARGDRIYVDTIRGAGRSKKLRGYEVGAFDFLVAVLPEERPKFWVIPFGEMLGRRCLTLPDSRPAGWELI